MLSYMRLIIREPHKHGGQGWLTYDTVFRLNNQENSQARNILDSSLHTAYVAGQSLPPCIHCNETDHSQEECALAPTIPPVRTSQREQFPSELMLLTLRLTELTLLTLRLMELTLLTELSLLTELTELTELSLLTE